MNDLQVFAFGDRMVRTIVKDGEPLWIAKDVCEVLGISNSRDAVSGLDDDELVSVITTSGGQNREFNAVTESGLYNLIFRSRKPEARAFRRWVTHDVLPSIRKTGMYAVMPLEKRISELIERNRAELNEKTINDIVAMTARVLCGKKPYKSSYQMQVDEHGDEVRAFVAETYPTEMRPVKEPSRIIYDRYLTWAKRQGIDSPLAKVQLFKLMGAMMLGETFLMWTSMKTNQKAWLFL